MKLISLTQHKIDQLNTEYNMIEKQIEDLHNKTPKDLWMNDINELLKNDELSFYNNCSNLKIKFK